MCRFNPLDRGLRPERRASRPRDWGKRASLVTNSVSSVTFTTVPFPFERRNVTPRFKQPCWWRGAAPKEKKDLHLLLNIHKGNWTLWWRKAGERARSWKPISAFYRNKPTSSLFSPLCAPPALTNMASGCWCQQFPAAEPWSPALLPLVGLRQGSSEGEAKQKNCVYLTKNTDMTWLARQIWTYTVLHSAN